MMGFRYYRKENNMCKRILLPTDNRHVKVDERGTEYFFQPKHAWDDSPNPEGSWLPGIKKEKHFVWRYKPNSKTKVDKSGQLVFTEGRFYDRPRPYKMVTGQTKRVRVTRYTFEEFNRPSNSPKGRNGQYYKYAHQVCNRAVYYDGERFWKNGDVRICRNAWFNHTIVPFDGFMWDAWPEQSDEHGIPVVGIWCHDGVPYQVELDGDVFGVNEGEWQGMYHQVLKLRAA